MKKECCNLNEVIQEFYNYLKSYILKNVQDKALAEDIVQDVMVKLINTHRDAKEIKNIKAWLFKVSKNAIYDSFKKNNLTFELQKDWDISEDANADFSIVLTEDYVIPMIEMLPEKYAVPLLLADIEKTPHKTIAAQLNMSLSATKMRIQRARIKLRELFVECCTLEYDKNGAVINCTVKEYCEPLQTIDKQLKNS